MKIFINMMKLITLSVFTVLTQISCDRILEKSLVNYDVLDGSQSRINLYKQEAKLLLKASKNNLEILELCETIKKVDTQIIVSHLTRRLEKVHFEIAKNYDDLSEDKLILIPSYTRSSILYYDTATLDLDSAFIENKLKLILNKTEKQIQLLDTLGNTTNNVDFKVLVIKDTQKLKSNIDKIEMTLNRLNQLSESKGTKKLLL